MFKCARLVSVLALAFGCLAFATSAYAESYGHDGLDRLTLVTYDDGSTVAYQYDAAGNVLSRTVPEPGTAGMLIAGILLLLGLRSGRGSRLSLILAVATTGLSGPRPALAQSAATPEASASWQQDAWDEIRKSEYAVSYATGRRGRSEAWQAPNRKHGFRTRFLEDKIQVVPRDSEDGSWEIGLGLEGYGRGSGIDAIGKSTPRIDGSRVRYSRGDVVEWFVNEPAGLKQGFTLRAPPRSPRRGRAGRGGRRGSSVGTSEAPAFVSLRVEGDARPVLAADRQSVSFESSEAMLAVAHYAELIVLDADGTQLDSWMEVHSDDGAHSIRLVFDDADAAYPIEIDPVLTTPAWNVSGNQPEAGLGFSVAGAGDVNGDGFDDVLVGVPFFDYAGITDSGRVYLFLGSPSGLSSIAAWVRNSPDATGTDLFGYALAGGEDVNDDGFDDFLVTELNPFTPGPGPTVNGTGIVYLFLGSPVGPSTTPDWQIAGRPGDRLGFSVAMIGADDARGLSSANGDGYADIVIGEPGTWGYTNDGRVYVFYGQADDLTTGAPLLGGADACVAQTPQDGGALCGGAPATNATIWGQSGTWDYFGQRVASAGDINCDGNKDLVLGQPRWDSPNSLANYGRIQVLAGSPTGIDPLQSQFWEIHGNVVGSGDNFFGASVASIPYFDPADPSAGCDEVLVGAPGRDTGGGGVPWDVGAVYKVEWDSGSDSLVLSAPLIEGTDDGERLGDSIAVLGDVNGDDEIDFLFGAPGGKPSQGGSYYDNNAAVFRTGRVYMKTGPAPPYPANQPIGNLPVVWRITGDEGDHLGSAIASVGDVDGDSLDDFVVGSSSGLNFLFNPGYASDIIPDKPGEVRFYKGRIASLVGSILGFATDAFSDAWAYIARGGPGDTQLIASDESPSSPAVSAGPAPGSLLITSGLAQDEAAGSTDWGDDGERDIAGAGLSLVVPQDREIGSLRFTTQYITADPNPTTPPTIATIYVNGESAASALVLETPIAEAGRGTQHAPMSHGIAIGETDTQVVLRFHLEETTAGAADVGLLVSRMFFSELPLPDHVNGDYIPNPVSTDVSKSQGSFSYRLPFLDVPGGQLPVQVALMYSSEDDREGPLGPGWRHSLQASISEDRDYQTFDQLQSPPVAVPGNGCPDSIYVEIGPVTEVFDEPEGEVETTCHLIDYAPRHPGVFSTLDRLADGTYVHETKVGTKSTFEPVPGIPGVLRRTEIENEWNESIVFSYDAATPRLPISFIDSVGEFYLLTYDDVPFESPRLTGFFGSIYDVGFDYDASGALASVFDVNGLETAIVTDSRGRVSSIVDADGTQIVGNEYEAFAGAGFGQEGRRLLRQTNGNPVDAGAAFAYDGEYFEVISREGGRVLERYDPYGRLADRRVLIDETRFGDLENCPVPDPDAPIADPWCALTQYEYDADGNVIQQTDPRGFANRMKYDDRGNQICMTEDAEGLSAIPARMPVRTRMIYDEFNNVVQQLSQKERDVLPDNCPDVPPYDVLAPGDAEKWNATLYTYDPVTGTGPLSIVKVGGEVADRVLTMGYDGSLVSTTTDALGRASSYAYDGLSNLSSRTDPLGNVTSFAHDALGRTTLQVAQERTHFEGGIEGTGTATRRQFWDAGGRLLSNVDPLLGTTTFTYDARGRELTRVDEDGETWTRSYTPTGMLATVKSPPTATNPLGNEIVLSYDQEDRLVSLTDARGNESTRSYDARGLMTESVDPLGGTRSFEYDEAGNPTGVSGPLRFVEDAGGSLVETRSKSEVEYDAQGRESLFRDPLGNEEVLTRDAQGRILTRSRPDPSGPPAAWTQAYATTGEVATSTDPEGVSTEFAYSSTGMLAESTRVQAGQTTRLEYDALDRVSEVRVMGTGSEPVVSVLDFEGASAWTPVGPSFLEDGFILETPPGQGLGGVGFGVSDGNQYLIAPLSIGVEYAVTLRVDALAGVTFDLISIDIADVATVLGVQDVGLISIVADGVPYEFTPTSPTFSTEILDLEGLTTLTISIRTDTAGGVFDRFVVDNITVRSAERVLVTAGYAYDEVGNLTTITDPNGNDTEYGYDRMDRKTLERDAMGEEVLFAYDVRGALATQTNARGDQVQYEYDEEGLPIGTTSVDTATGAWSIAETVDNNGNVTESLGSNSTNPSLAPATINREFDALDRQTVRTVTLGAGPGLTKTVRSEYDLTGNLTAVVYSDGSRVEYNYDELDRLVRITDVDIIDGDRTTTYEYDVAGRLSKVKRPDGSETTYQYDLAGRLVDMTDQRLAAMIFSAQYTLDAAGRRVSAQVVRPLDPVAAASESFTYDLANRIEARSSGGAALVHDADGNLVTATLGGASRTLAYNSMNQLVSVDGESIRYDADGRRVSRTTGGVTTFYVYDTEGRLIEEIDSSGQTIARYVHGLGLVSREAAGGVSVYHYDSRGSTVALTDLQGAVTDSYAYSPFGAVAASTGTTPNPFTYSGRDGVVDDGNGLYHMPLRYYAPELMRFIQKDPVYSGEFDRPLSLNRYAFVEGNPIERIDPLGACTFCLDVWDSTVGAVIDGAEDAYEVAEALGSEIVDLAQDGVDEIGGWERVGLYVAAGALMYVTVGISTPVLVGAAAGAGVTTATGGNIVDGAIFGAVAGTGYGGMALGGFGQGYLGSDGSFEDKLTNGAIGAGVGLVAGRSARKLGSQAKEGLWKTVKTSVGAKVLAKAAAAGKNAANFGL